MAPWLYNGLLQARLPIICIEARHASGMLKGRPNKTDKNDARGIAEIMRAGLYRSVHIKSPDALGMRSLLAARRILKQKLRDLESAIGGLLLGFGLKLAPKLRLTYERRVAELIAGRPFVASVIEPLLAVRAAIAEQVRGFNDRVAASAEADPVCRRLMTVPGVGVQTAVAFRYAVDDPHRFARSRCVGAHFGLTPRVWKSAEVERRGGISRFGDVEVRSALYLAARGMLHPKRKPTWLSEWARQVAERRGTGIAVVALARRLACVLHSMWITETDFRDAVHASGG